jgi:hypothetical protein
VLGTDAYLATLKSIADATKVETDLTNAGDALSTICP